jgi:hypothetical protein
MNHVNLCFVLSSGRTGTVHLTKALASALKGVHAVHEPAGARSQLMLANAANLAGGHRRGLRWLFRRGLKERTAELASGDTYVEVNPMLCAHTDLVAELPEPFSLVHAVRDPRTWVPSIRKFRAAGIRRHLIDYTPFANPYPVPRPPGWLAMPRDERALWRWRYCNEQILALRPHARRFAQIRYEDLFGDPAEQTIRTVLSTMGLPSDDVSWFDTSTRTNPAPEGARIEVSEEDVQRICGDLLSQFGYE